MDNPSLTTRVTAEFSERFRAAATRAGYSSAGGALREAARQWMEARDAAEQARPRQEAGNAG